MRNTIIYILLIITLLPCVASCTRGERDYSSWTELPASGWAYGASIRLWPLDTTLRYNDSLVHRPLLLGLTHANDYAYSNVWLEVTYESDRLRYRDTVNIRLSDIYGRWLGSGFGSGYQREVELSPGADIDLRRPVIVRHIMRLDTLRGIEHIGISVK